MRNGTRRRRVFKLRSGHRRRIQVSPQAYRAINDICSEGPLSQEEEDALANSAFCGDQEAANKLAMHSTRLAVSAAEGFAGRGVPFEDLVGEALVALFEVARRYEPRGLRFAALANYAVINAVKMALSNQAGALCLRGRSGAIAQPAAGLDAPSETAYGKTISDSLIDDMVPPDEKLHAEQVTELVNGFVSSLTKEEQLVVRSRFLDDDKVKLRDLGDSLGKSHEYVRRVEVRALAKMKKRHGPEIRKILDD